MDTLFAPGPYIVHTFLPSKKGRPLNNGQNAGPQCVHYSEVPLYTVLKLELITPSLLLIHSRSGRHGWAVWLHNSSPAQGHVGLSLSLRGRHSLLAVLLTGRRKNSLRDPKDHSFDICTIHPLLLPLLLLLLLICQHHKHPIQS